MIYEENITGSGIFLDDKNLKKNHFLNYLKTYF